jgi:tellurite resistance protein TerC
VLDALHENQLPFINNGEPLYSVPTVGIELSLGVIIGVLLVTTVASLIKARKSPETAKESG